GLLIARNVDRRGELAVFASLGASRARLGRQMTIEAGLLALAGGFIGLALASGASRALAAVLPANVAGAADVQLDATVVGFSIAVSALTAVVAGLIPVFGIGSISASEALTGARRSGPRSQRLHTVLVVGEVAAAMMLVLGASLMSTSFAALLGRDRGFNPHGMLALNVSLPFEQDRYENPALRAAELEGIVARVAQLPGVTAAGATNGFPGSALGVLGNVLLKPQVPEATGEIQGVLRSATPDYFRAMGVAIRDGRAFTSADTAAAPRVAIVNETLARQMWGDATAVGRVILLPRANDPAETAPWTVVGVAGDMRLGTRAPADIFLPVAQKPAFWIDLVMRTDGDPTALVPVVRRALRDLNGELLIENSRSIDSIISNRLGLERAQSVFATVIAALAAVVAGVGLYALLSFAVAQRTREFAIRLALGSAPRALFGNIFIRGLRLAAIGVVIGSLATFGLIRLLRSQVFGLDAASPGAFVVSAAALLLIASLALLGPARRVLRAQAIAAIRQ
ncbi:MAG TPA: FtsX-like permease family protein, partial [Vicinamibacterales bacterium]|nr:FtsX-like permease family protein [Vicinamibacterales bacterium]